MANEAIQREAAASIRGPAVQVEPAAAANGQQTPEPQPAPRGAEKRDFLRRRLLSLDVYRGLIMVTLAFNGFGLAATATRHLRAEGPSPFWEAVHYQFEHVEWVGCGYWDLIQPSFMFMVGLAAAFSYAKRRQLGQSYAAMFGHAVWRSLVLIFLGIFLISNWSRTGTVWSLMNVLTQIGLGYWLLFLLWDRPFRVQVWAAALILVATWALYVAYPFHNPLAGINLETGDKAVGVTRQWAQANLTGLSPAWHKNANVGHALDVWLLNLVPRNEPFVFNNGGYQTLNFLPSLATMLFGLMCGELLRSARPASRKLLILVAAGAAGLALGQFFNLTGICPLIKRLWTPSWALFSTGWCCLILAGLFAVVDVIGLRRWAFPLVVVGVNSLAIYCMSMLLKPWAAQTLRIHFGPSVFAWLGPLYEPAVQAVLVGLFFWLACLWMYRQKIFMRI
jgi:predicted acyltransferase